MTLYQVQGYLVFGFDFDFRLHKLTFFLKYREHSSLLQGKTYTHTKRIFKTMVNLRINQTFNTGAVRKPHLPDRGKMFIYFSGLP